jgi:molybdopterin synthase sulfur carrier subunit
MKVNFFATFRPIVGGKTVEVDFAQDSTLRQLLQALIARYPGLGQALFDASNNLHQHVHVFVNGRDWAYLTDQLDTKLSAEDVINIFPPVGGG